MIVTKEIRITSKKMLWILYLQYGTSWMILLILGVFFFVLLGILLNYKFFILVLIWLFLCIPLIVAFLYFFYGMKPLTVFNSISHKLIFVDNDIRIRLFEINKDESGKVVKKEMNASHDYKIKKTEINEIKNGGDYVILISRPKGILWLPMESFNSAIEFKNVTSDIILRMTNGKR